MTTTVRVSEAARRRAAEIASREGTSIGVVVERALAEYERREFWRQTQAALAAHPEALEPDPAWERATPDGLERE